jgi:hypothetical protein
MLRGKALVPRAGLAARFAMDAAFCSVQKDGNKPPLLGVISAATH